MSFLDQKAVRILSKVVAELRQLGIDVSDPEVDDGLHASEKGDRGAVAFGDNWDVFVQIPNGAHFDGEDEEGRSPGWGFGFGADADWAGMGLGGVMYNYTADVWTRDREEIRSRLDMLSYDAASFAYEVKEWLEKHKGI